MTRGPVTQFPSAKRAVAAYNWLSNEENYLEIKKAFDSTSRYARLQSIKPKVVGKYLFIRFAAKTGN
jgi:hydroxymethylglutaryl-CoA reductase (NADPH)